MPSSFSALSAFALLFLASSASAEGEYVLGDKAALRKMKTSELRAALAARGQTCEGCSEKNDFADELFAKQALPTLEATPPPAPSAAAPAAGGDGGDGAAAPPPEFNYADIMAKMNAGKSRVERVKKLMAARGMDTSAIDSGMLGSLSDSTMDDEKLIELLSAISGYKTKGGDEGAAAAPPSKAPKASAAKKASASKAPKASAAKAGATPKVGATPKAGATAKAGAAPKAGAKAGATPKATASYRAGTVDDPKVKAALEKSAQRAAARKNRASGKGGKAPAGDEEEGGSDSEAPPASKARKGNAAADGGDEDEVEDEEEPTPKPTPKPTPRKFTPPPRRRPSVAPREPVEYIDEAIDLDEGEEL